MGYFAQQSLDVLNSDLAVIEQLQQDFPQDGLGSLRTLAGAFQLSGEDVDKKIRALCGGEKSRLAIARMLYNPPNFLALDEPTNHWILRPRKCWSNRSGIPSQSNPQNRFSRFGENYRFIETDLRLTEGLAHAVRRRDDIRVEQRDVNAFRMSECQQHLMQVRQSCCGGASVATASHDQHANFMLQQFGVNMM